MQISTDLAAIVVFMHIFTFAMLAIRLRGDITAKFWRSFILTTFAVTFTVMCSMGAAPLAVWVLHFFSVVPGPIFLGAISVLAFCYMALALVAYLMVIVALSFDIPKAILDCEKRNAELLKSDKVVRVYTDY